MLHAFALGYRLSCRLILKHNTILIYWYSSRVARHRFSRIISRAFKMIFDEFFLARALLISSFSFGILVALHALLTVGRRGRDMPPGTQGKGPVDVEAAKITSHLNRPADSTHTWK